MIIYRSRSNPSTQQGKEATLSLKSNRRPQQLKPYRFSKALRRRDRNVSNRGRFVRYDHWCRTEAWQRIAIDPIQQELDADHVAQVNEDHPGIHSQVWTPPLWWRFEIDDEYFDDRDGIYPLEHWERELLATDSGSVGYPDNDETDDIRPRPDADHICDGDCRFVYCPANPDDSDDDINRYPGSWMPYVSSRDEKLLLPEVFDGWGYKVTTRP
jgi:hypothetical protein